VVAVLLGGTLTARYLASDHSHARRPAATKSSRGAQLQGVVGSSSPVVTPTPTPTRKHPTPHVSSSSARPAASHSTTPPPVHTSTPRPTTPPPAPPVKSATCKHPVFHTSDPNGGWQDGNYYVYQDMWNASGYSVQQSLYACSHSNWYVVATMNNNNGDGAVKTYPNAHEDFNERKISSFHSITSSFAEHSAHTGIYEDAYDIWLNGVASSGSTEVMVWTENFHQVPSGSVQASATFSGRRYKIYHSGSYIALVANSNFTSGTVDLLSVFHWLMNKGWIPSSSTLGQIDYGVELVSTDNSPATFTFNNFSISTS
jgi:hypothetical protein